MKRWKFAPLCFFFQKSHTGVWMLRCWEKTLNKSRLEDSLLGTLPTLLHLVKVNWEQRKMLQEMDNRDISTRFKGVPLLDETELRQKDRITAKPDESWVRRTPYFVSLYQYWFLNFNWCLWCEMLATEKHRCHICICCHILKATSQAKTVW